MNQYDKTGIVQSYWGNNLIALQEQHNMTHKAKEFKINLGDVAMIKEQIKKQGSCKIGIMQEVYQGKDQVIRTVRIKTWKRYLEQPMKLLYPLKLSCNIEGNINKSKYHHSVEISNEIMESK